MTARPGSAVLGAALALSLLHVPAARADMTETEIREGWIEHAALAQLHRWYQLYERPASGIDNALDILAEDVVVSSGLGEARGHAAYAERVARLPDTWRNSHTVESSEVRIGDDRIELDARVTYLNVGMAEGGAVRRAGLDYETVLERTEAILPVFASITIGQRSEDVAEGYVDAYAANRLSSLVHYYLAVIEHPGRDPEPMRELLAEGFSLNFSSGAITDFDGFAAWLAGPGSQVVASTHRISNLTHETLAEDERYRLSVDFDWEGILPDGTIMTARTRHDWTVSNDVTERFARIESVDVEVLEPFAPKGAGPEAK